MPILETGRTDHPAARRDAGYTLIEALTTLGVVALMASAVVLAAPGPDRRARDAAERLAARLTFAGEESVTTNRTVAFIADDKGYVFAHLHGDGWRRIEGRSPLAFRAWPADSSFRVEGATRDVILDEEAYGVFFSPTGDATPARIVLTSSGARYDIDVDTHGATRVARHD